jgi:hypothetical protein
MALKGDRVVIETDITLTCPTATERGVVLCRKTAGSGVALGATAGAADLYTDPSGKVPVGMLLNDVVDVDETRYHRNFQKDEMKKGERVTILRKGRLTTNKISGTPTDGATAYLGASGQLTPTLSTTGGLVATPKVGQFVGGKDENGYQTVDINLPVV